MSEDNPKPPTPPWEMTTEQSKAAMAYINTHAKKLLSADHGCPVCGGVNWNLSPSILEVRSFTFGDILTHGVIQPLFILQCKTCQLMLPFQAVNAGVISKEEMKEGWHSKKDLNLEGDSRA